MKLAQFRQISAAINADLATLFDRHGLAISKLTAGVEETAGTVRITLQLNDLNMTDAAGNATTPEEERYKKMAYLYKMKPEWLHRTFTAGGATYTVIGLNQTRGSKCVRIRRADGKVFVATAEHVIRAFPKEVA